MIVMIDDFDYLLKTSTYALKDCGVVLSFFFEHNRTETDSH